MDPSNNIFSFLRRWCRNHQFMFIHEKELTTSLSLQEKERGMPRRGNEMLRLGDVR